MLLIYILVIAMLAMARKPQRRRRRWSADMQRVQVFQTMTLGTLANVSVIVAGITGGSDNEYRWLSIKGLWSLRGLTAGEGPLVFGVSHGDYSLTEIDEFLENEAAMNRGDMIAKEISTRRIRRIGVFSGLNAVETINDGKPITTRLNYAMADGSLPAMWVYNRSGATLTTGANLVFTGQITLRWT